MQNNLKNFEKHIKEEMQAGRIGTDSIVVCECDRAFGKTYKANYIVDVVPCLKTGNKYLFILSTCDINLPDEQRKFSRWLMPYERPSLQGCNPDIALHMTATELIHATGNAYPTTLIAACCIPVFNAIASTNMLLAWPPPEMIKIQDKYNLPDITKMILKKLKERPKPVTKPKGKQGASTTLKRPRLTTKPGKKIQTR